MIGPSFGRQLPDRLPKHPNHDSSDLPYFICLIRGPHTVLIRLANDVCHMQMSREPFVFRLTLGDYFSESHLALLKELCEHSVFHCFILLTLKCCKSYILWFVYFFLVARKLYQKQISAMF